MQKKIWIIEDSEDAIFVYLDCIKQKYQLLIFRDLISLTQKLKESSDRPDLFIFDLNLNGVMTTDFLDTDRQLLNETPFVVVSSSDDPHILEKSFELGSLDYFTKPFNSNELMFKLEKIFGKINITSNNFNVRLDLEKLLISREKFGSVKLTYKEYLIIMCIEKKCGFATREDIHKYAWQDDVLGEKTIDVHLSRLRKKLSKLHLSIHLQENQCFEMTELCNRMDEARPI